MSESSVKTYTDFVLPSKVVTKVDVSRLVSEAERIDNEMTTADVRQKAGSEVQPKPSMTDQLAELIDKNKISLDNSLERSEFIVQLRKLKDSVPVVHMTFAGAADQESLETLVDWFRSNVNPQTVFSVGLQPSLVAGVYIRTPNHVHDLSLRALLKGKHGELVKELEALSVNG